MSINIEDIFFIFCESRTFKISSGISILKKNELRCTLSIRTNQEMNVKKITHNYCLKLHHYT